MELMNLYDQIRNPIEDSKVIQKLIIAYAKSYKRLGGFYGQLTKTVEKEHTQGQFYREDADRFYSMMFNKWKNSIVALTREQFLELYKDGSYGQDFIKMREFLKTIPDIKTQQEANDIFSKNYKDKELENAIEKYRWNALGENTFWIHVCSRYLTAKQDDYPNVEHRLYIDTESYDTYKLLNLLVEKLDEYHLPYYFKFDRWADRDDTIVIYSSTENLIKYVELLQEIKKEHPDLISRIKEPPILTGKIDDWIGYGSEPSRTPDGKNHSFNGIRAKLIESSITTTVKQWILNHRNMEITYQDQVLTFQDYLAMKSTEKMLEETERLCNYYEGLSYSQDGIVTKLGYTLQDVKSSVWKDNIYKSIKEQMSDCLVSACNGDFNEMPPIKISVRNGKQIEFTGSVLEEIIREEVVNILKFDQDFIQYIYSGIVAGASEYGIDTDKFCFDVKARERIRYVATQTQAKQRNQLLSYIYSLKQQLLESFNSKGKQTKK